MVTTRVPWARSALRSRIVDWLCSRFSQRWRVTNTGVVALTAQAGRGGFYPSSTGTRRWEELRYRGVHFVEAFIVLRSGDTLVGKSKPFHVVIE